MQQDQKKSIAIIGQDCFLQCDIPVIPSLKDTWQVTWYPLFLRDNRRGHTPKDVTAFGLAHDVKVTPLLMRYRMRELRGFMQLVSWLLEIRRARYDVIHINAVGKPYLSMLARCILGNKNVIFAIHDVHPHKAQSDYRENLLYNSSIRRLFPHLHTWSRTQQAVLKEQYGKASSYAPHPLLDYGPLPTGQRKDPRKTFLFFGTLSANKGIDRLVAAGKALHEKGVRDFRILIAGKPNALGITSLLKDLPDCFEVQPRVIANEEIPALHAEADFVVLPYSDVTQSGPLMTAYNYSIPAITPDHDGFKEFLDQGHIGIIYPYALPGGLESSMKAALEMTPEDYGNLVTRLKHHVQDNYSNQSLCTQFSAMYEHLLEKQ